MDIFLVEVRLSNKKDLSNRIWSRPFLNLQSCKDYAKHIMEYYNFPQYEFSKPIPCDGDVITWEYREENTFDEQLYISILLYHNVQDKFENKEVVRVSDSEFHKTNEYHKDYLEPSLTEEDVEYYLRELSLGK